MTFRLPNPPEVPYIISSDPTVSELQFWARRLSAYVAEEFRKRVPAGSAVSSLYLTSPNGSVYNVQVADDGTLSTTLVLGPGDSE